MRGKISQWKDNRGFGFILPDDGTGKLFFHISSVKTCGRRPKIGDIVLYDSMHDSQNRLKAKAVVIEGVGNKSSLRATSMISQTPPPKKNSLNYVLILLLLSCLLGVAFLLFQSGSINNAISSGPGINESQSSISDKSSIKSDAIIANAFSNHESNLQVSGQGIVMKLLPDDNIGSRHQKFIIKLSSGQTLLMAHNIDLAHRIGSLREGDSVQFYGEYEWNNKGGVIHWTHRDPSGSHVAGWLQHQGKRYE
ncbi:MAG: DUF3465 domain-containing protein [Desulfobacteraceae bacterium]|jgi:cold shock CspA family protein|nr:DUF3465 domain-containing protein [Desulfobacteraceae bacterium]